MRSGQSQPSLGRLLADARRARGLSLRELGARLTGGGGRPRGVSAQFLNDLEHDRRRPSPALAGEIAGVLGLSPAWLEAAAGRGAPAVVDYLRERPEAAEPVGRLFRRARESGWTRADWSRLLQAAGEEAAGDDTPAGVDEVPEQAEVTVQGGAAGKGQGAGPTRSGSARRRRQEGRQ